MFSNAQFSNEFRASFTPTGVYHKSPDAVLVSSVSMRGNMLTVWKETYKGPQAPRTLYTNGAFSSRPHVIVPVMQHCNDVIFEVRSARYTFRNGRGFHETRDAQDIALGVIDPRDRSVHMVTGSCYHTALDLPLCRMDHREFVWVIFLQELPHMAPSIPDKVTVETCIGVIPPEERSKLVGPLVARRAILDEQIDEQMIAQLWR